MKNMIRIICFAAAFLLLFAACRETSVSAAPTAAPAEPTAEPTAEPEEEIVGLAETPAPAETQQPTLAPQPSEEPAETAAPAPAQREGDLTDHFPDYDTGVDADYSYQSDELRIAIKVLHETMPDHTGRELKETIYIADVWVRNLNSMHMAFANGTFDAGTEEGSVLAQRENAILAINGSYYQGFLLREGQIYRRLRQNKGWNSGAACILYRDGSMKTFYLNNESLNYDREIENGAWFGWQFGPIVIRDYEEGPGATSYHNMGFKARNILGYYEPGHYVIVTCDNRGEDAQGMNEYMMVNLMKSLGVKDAFNLDGGTSAVLVFMGKVINHPTLRNDDGSVVEGRPIADMLMFGECGEDGAFTALDLLTPAKTTD